MLECHPQTLRLYEREGLIEPERSDAGVRLYCDADIESLRRIQRFTQELGVNLAGVSIILRLVDQIEEPQEEPSACGRTSIGPSAPAHAPERAQGGRPNQTRARWRGERRWRRSSWPTCREGAGGHPQDRRGLRPEKIIIFGSYARGDWTETKIRCACGEATEERPFDRSVDVGLLALQAVHGHSRRPRASRGRTEERNCSHGNMREGSWSMTERPRDLRATWSPGCRRPGGTG